jgi:hypothetical protein
VMARHAKDDQVRKPLKKAARVQQLVVCFLGAQLRPSANNGLCRQVVI